jgi:hypothetical protein
MGGAIMTDTLTLFTVQFSLKTSAYPGCTRPCVTMLAIDVFAESEDQAKVFALDALSRPTEWDIDSIVEN